MVRSCVGDQEQEDEDDNDNDGSLVVGDSLDKDKQILLKLKNYLDNKTLADQGKYIYWNTNSSNSNPCQWQGILCSKEERVIGIDLSNSDITGEVFQSFSQLTELTHLDLSQNTLFGYIPDDLRNCQKLLHLNLSHNILDGELNVTGLTTLQMLDLSLNRFHGEIGLLNFPSMCGNLVTLNISGNNLTGEIGDSFDQCSNLKYLDLSTNKLSGGIWNGFARLTQFSVAENQLNGNISYEAFPLNCELVELDLSQNGFVGEAPKEVANCKNLTMLNLSSNNFTGVIPIEMGSISRLKGLYLGGNNFSRDIPETLLNLTNLVFLDLSRNKFGGDIQKIFGRFQQT
ncbi:LRR receptor-like kinase resistance protein [Trifolium pratense]|uniref:LRR receptor-like kinase resistance protein n=2 Tax=Trifolium pratense TaxID=57577 RepID=A0A2K3KZG3_TRIPR|nr:LRR receptor-like kinase resistance protein [Trifolium pratense]